MLETLARQGYKPPPTALGNPEQLGVMLQPPAVLVQMSLHIHMYPFPFQMIITC